MGCRGLALTSLIIEQLQQSTHTDTQTHYRIHVPHLRMRTEANQCMYSLAAQYNTAPWIMLYTRTTVHFVL